VGPLRRWAEDTGDRYSKSSPEEPDTGALCFDSLAFSADGFLLLLFTLLPSLDFLPLEVPASAPDDLAFADFLTGTAPADWSRGLLWPLREPTLTLYPQVVTRSSSLPVSWQYAVTLDC